MSSLLGLGHGGAVAVDAQVVDGAAAEEGGDAVQVEELERQGFNEGVVDDVEKSSAISETIFYDRTSLQQSFSDVCDLINSQSSRQAQLCGNHLFICFIN